jgi:hypothetical protein
VGLSIGAIIGGRTLTVILMRDGWVGV